MAEESLIGEITTHIDEKLRSAGLPKAAGESGIYSDFIVRETLAYLQRGEIPLTFDVYGRLEEFLKKLAIQIGKPLIRTSFPGPEAHKLTVDEYAFEIGKTLIIAAIEPSRVEEVKDIDGDFPKTRYDAPFPKRESVDDDYFAQQLSETADLCAFYRYQAMYYCAYAERGGMPTTEEIDAAAKQLELNRIAENKERNNPEIEDGGANAYA